MKNSAIEWTHHTFNPWEGCQKVSPACDHCYAETRNKRYAAGVNWGPKAPRRRTSVKNWNLPIKWNKEAAESGIRYRVFCASLADVFDNQADPNWREDLWRLIASTPNLDWLLLTKRPQNIAKMLPADWGDAGYPNVWLGASVENQTEADRRIPALLSVPAVIHFLSCEPLLGFVDLASIHCGDGVKATVSWVIIGGESGTDARPMHPEWARSIRDQCIQAGVPVLFKQWGEWLPYGMGDAYQQNFKDASVIYATPEDEKKKGGWPVYWVGKKNAGRTLDGVVWDQYPIGQPA